MENAGLPMSLCPSLTPLRRGTVVMTRHYAGDGRTIDHVTIDHADPRILVSDDLLNEVAQNLSDTDQPVGEPYYAENFRFGLRLEPSPHPRLCSDPAICPDGCFYPSHPFCWTSWLLHIDAKDRHLVYRIGQFDMYADAWEAAWPD